MDSSSDLQHQPSPTTSTTAQECDSNPGHFWIYFIILIAFSAIILCLYLFWRLYWKERNGKHLVLVKDVEKGDVEFAFDNPGFKEGTPLPQIKILNGSKGMKWTTSPADKPVNNISNGKKPRSVDDSNLHLQNSQNTNVVPLKSRDFAGLGFNIYGNMRDGIFVKNILHHGPASESGKITTGDRISAVRINFSHIVYEDALAILTYASPYEMQVEVEKCQNWSFGSLKTDMKHSKNLSHPLYRSQSSSDLSQLQNNIFESPTTDKLFQSVSNKPAVLQVVSETTEKVPIKSNNHIIQSPSNTSNNDTKSSSSINNTTVIINNNHNHQNNSKTHQPNFDEVDLNKKNDDNIIIEEQILDQNKGENQNMKQKLVKGFQNIKDKINNHIQKDKKHTKDATDIVYCNNNVDLKPQLKRNDSMGSNDKATLSRSKKKPPPPPPIRSSSDPSQNNQEIGLIDEIENEINKYNFDSDSERDVDMNKKIQLNSSQITVHHIPEENRKSSSLGDLSKIVDEDQPPLERAVSLELDDSISSPSSKKRKAPLPPPEDIPDELPYTKELKLELAAEAKLKRASIFGTLEEAMKQDDDDDDEIVSSTPIKTDDFISIGSNSSWELNFELQEPKDIVLVAGQDSTSATPTKEYVTEITLADKMDTGLFVTALDQSNINHNHYSELSESSEPLDLKPSKKESSPDINHNRNEFKLEEKKSPLNSTPTSREISPSKSPNSNSKSPKSKVPVSKIPIRANTEPTFKVAEKSKAKYLSNVLYNGNGKINFSTYSISPNKSDIHTNGSIHEPSITQITVDSRK